ncbi:lpg0008 family Dot/Icm T4SS effector [Legionella bozemanae]|uniref:lpg0008 family Dot/Icm T4SS effector n=1 Tax=Legionella bozemanae TaxID=447 RepID=UPI003EEF13DF
MAFTRIEIIALENPYEQLSDGDALAKNAEMLNTLSDKEQVALATKIIAACPEAKFKQYAHHIRALGNLTKSEDTFYSVLSEAYQVRQRINSLLDSRNKAPHVLFLGKEFNPAPFHRFNTLAKHVLESNEPVIAERVALCTPEQDRSQVAHNISTTFPKHSLAEKIQIAFMMRRNIERLLLGDNPEKFFTSRDYNKDSCRMFINMFRALLKGHEETIGEKLCAIQSESARASVKRHLELLHTEVFDETNPFKLIADSLSAKESSEQKKTGAQTTNPYGYFNSRSPTPPLSIIPTNDANEKELSQRNEEEEDDESTLSDSFTSTSL